MHRTGIQARQLIFGLLMLVQTMMARADLVIEITQGVDSALPIAIVPFRVLSEQSPTEDLAGIISDDLLRTGEFAPLPTERMLSLPAVGKDIYFREWRLLGQRYIVVGQVRVSPADQQVELTYELYDVSSQQRVLGERIAAPLNQQRRLAHRVADAVYEALTGVRGVFSTRIAYVLLRNTSKGVRYVLEVADADGRNARVIAESAQPIISPSWSPDGRQIAYVSFERRRRPAIFIQDVRTGARRQIQQFEGLNSAPAWSPDGRKLALTLSKDGNAEIYILDLTTNRLRRLTNHWAIDTEPSWSPDGRSLVFTSDRGGGPQIYQISAEGGAPVRLTFEGRYNARPRFSDDGLKVYYVHQRDGAFHVAALDLGTRETTVLSDTGMDESPSVAPNGKMVIYATQRKGKGVLAVVSVVTGSRYLLPSQDGDVREPAWSPWLKP
ncbi:Tol-Pal system beta propeller repeat protein TolB [Hahella sp. SMD15-11]|uniref:Tol-Pal system protein TolB n=1 Tax=Thermohahella caldifontis TaxID=3142973 RepID=A0AB39UXH0_9GAMM